MPFSCPNSTCSLLFSSFEQVVVHLSDDLLSCGFLLANQLEAQNFDEELIDNDSDSEGS